MGQSQKFFASFFQKRRPCFLLASALLLPAHIAAAQGTGPGWFVPAQPAAPAPAPARQATGRRVRQAAPPPVDASTEADVGPQAGDGQDQEPMPNLPQPPIPALPPVAKGAAPPAPIMGVLAVPDVMRQSSADQMVEKVLGERRDKLRADISEAQAALREAQQQLQADAPKLNEDQGHAREAALRERYGREQKGFRQRGRIIQEAAQVALGQIERTLVGVIKEVAAAHGMNLVLHRSQVALNVPEFDITDEVTTQLNKVLPTVAIPADGVDPATLVSQNGAPASSGQP